MTRLRRQGQCNVAAIVFAVLLLLGTACGGDDTEEARRYEAVRDAFSDALHGRSAPVAADVAAAYLDRLASGDSAPEPTIVPVFQPRFEQLNEFLCRRLRTVGEAAAEGPDELRDGRVEEARDAARDLVRDAMATALLKGALAASPDHREQLLAGLNVEAETSPGDMVHGMAALQDAGLIDSEGRLTFPERNTAEHSHYEKWTTDEASGFASVLNLLTDSTIKKIDECLPRPTA